MSAPLITCVMPTRDRPAFAAQALAYFARQDYEERELLVLDDGKEPIADLIAPHDKRIRYYRLPSTLTLGAKRNLGTQLSRGELIAHWDDDDWMATNRLSLQVQALTESGADLCGLRELLYYKPECGEAWRYCYPAAERQWLAGCTLVYRRAIALEHPFADITVGEDNAFLRQAANARFHAIADPTFYIGVIHSSNTSSKNTAGPRWARTRLGEVTRLLAHDRAFYADLRAGVTRVRPPQASHVNVAAHYDVSTGYGSMAEYAVLGMDRAGAAVDVIPLALYPEGTTPAFRKLVERSVPNPAAPTLYCSWPRPELQQFFSCPDLFLYTMWESERLPAGWCEQFNRARAVIVPSQFVARVFRENGVRVPVEVVPEGIDPEVYPFVERATRPGITTLTVGPVDDRKHVIEGIAAWKQAFAGDQNARLIIKSSYGYHNYVPDDPRIRYVDQVERTRGILHWYRQADVLMALGNEGFGLPLVEAMASGLPVIALNSEGQADVCREAHDCLLPVSAASWQVFDNRVYGKCGLRGVPSVPEVAEKLRWVATHREQARAMGAAASAWAHRHRNIWDKGPALLDVMERHLSVSRPLRRPYAMWTTSYGNRCGVAEYTAALAGALPRQVRVGAELPSVRRIRLLQVQHENALFQDAELASAVEQAADAHVPVVVTEHSIDERERSWERHADALVSLSRRGTEILKRRWPFKRIEHIPHGCPVWFPPRKRVRGRVIGGLGFLERHKGFWQLLEVLRTVPGTELLLFSYARSKQLESAWEQAACGLPVRRIDAYLPEAEIARRLAAEADILVFPYAEVSHVSVSGALRIGLASGVPVLCSRTSWFEEQAELTYQPDNLAEGITRLLEDTKLRSAVCQAAEAYCHQNSWGATADKHLALWQSLVAS